MPLSQPQQRFSKVVDPPMVKPQCGEFPKWRIQLHASSKLKYQQDLLVTIISQHKIFFPTTSKPRHLKVKRCKDLVALVLSIAMEVSPSTQFVWITTTEYQIALTYLEIPGTRIWVLFHDTKIQQLKVRSDSTMAHEARRLCADGIVLAPVFYVCLKYSYGCSSGIDDQNIHDLQMPAAQGDLRESHECIEDAGDLHRKVIHGVYRSL
ncbi:hypothetical protein V8B97DRAFT_1920466 [Scleroderma yunnanense]